MAVTYCEPKPENDLSIRQNFLKWGGRTRSGMNRMI